MQTVPVQNQFNIINYLLRHFLTPKGIRNIVPNPPFPLQLLREFTEQNYTHYAHLEECNCLMSYYHCFTLEEKKSKVKGGRKVGKYWGKLKSSPTTPASKPKYALLSAAQTLLIYVF